MAEMGGDGKVDDNDVVQVIKLIDKYHLTSSPSGETLRMIWSCAAC
jgi:hypothetical protein